MSTRKKQLYFSDMIHYEMMHVFTKYKKYNMEYLNYGKPQRFVCPFNAWTIRSLSVFSFIFESPNPQLNLSILYDWFPVDFYVKESLYCLLKRQELNKIFSPLASNSQIFIDFCPFCDLGIYWVITATDSTTKDWLPLYNGSILLPVSFQLVFDVYMSKGMLTDTSKTETLPFYYKF